MTSGAEAWRFLGPVRYDLVGATKLAVRCGWVAGWARFCPSPVRLPPCCSSPSTPCSRPDLVPTIACAVPQHNNPDILLLLIPCSRAYPARVRCLEGEVGRALSKHTHETSCGAGCAVCRTASFLHAQRSQRQLAAALSAASTASAVAAGGSEQASPLARFGQPGSSSSLSSSGCGGGGGASQPHTPAAASAAAGEFAGGSPAFVQPAAQAAERHEGEQWREVEGEFCSIMLLGGLVVGGRRCCWAGVGTADWTCKRCPPACPPACLPACLPACPPSRCPHPCPHLHCPAASPAVMPCRSDKTKAGMARFGHLSNGRLKLVLVRKCNPAQAGSSLYCRGRRVGGSLTRGVPAGARATLAQPAAAAAPTVPSLAALPSSHPAVPAFPGQHVAAGLRPLAAVVRGSSGRCGGAGGRAGGWQQLPQQQQQQQ